MLRWQAVAIALLPLACSSEGLLLESREGARPATPFELLVPRQSDAFTDSVGLTFRISATQTDAELLRGALLELSVRHARTFAPTPGSAAFRFAADLAGTEIGLHLVVDTRIDGAVAGLPALLDTLPTLESVEGPNDFDAYDKDLSPEQSIAALEELRSTLDLAGRRVLLVDGLDSLRSGVGDQAALLDRGNFERGRNTALPGAPLDALKAQARSICGDRPLFVTECGYSTLDGATGSVSEEVAARYVTRLFLSHFAQGIERTYWDELGDGPNSSRAEFSQGLIRPDGQRKPAFSSLQRLLALTADPGPPFETAPLELSLRSQAPELRRVLLQRRDGVRLLALWNEAPSWDAASKRPLTPEAVEVTLELAAATTFAVYRPLLGSEPIDSGRAQTLTLSVPDDVLVLELRPGDAR